MVNEHTIWIFVNKSFHCHHFTDVGHVCLSSNNLGLFEYIFECMPMFMFSPSTTRPSGRPSCSTSSMRSGSRSVSSWRHCGSRSIWSRGSSCSRSVFSRGQCCSRFGPERWPPGWSISWPSSWCSVRGPRGQSSLYQRCSCSRLTCGRGISCWLWPRFSWRWRLASPFRLASSLRLVTSLRLGFLLRLTSPSSLGLALV